MSVLKINANQFIPDYSYHVGENIIHCDGKLTSCFKIRGVPFESENENKILDNYYIIRDFLLNLSKQERVLLRGHLVKKHDSLDEKYKFNNKFSEDFALTYLNSLEQQLFFKTEYYLSVSIAIPSKASKSSFDEYINKLEEINSLILEGLKDFDINILGLNTTKDGTYFSEISEFLYYLVNHTETNIPLSSSKIKDSVIEGGTYFGYDTFVTKNKDENIYGINYVLKDLPRLTTVGHIDFILSLPYEFILTHSFDSYSLNKGINLVNKQLNKMNSVSDSSQSDYQDLELCKEFMQSGTNILGAFHSVLTVFGNTEDEARKNGVAVAGAFITAGKGVRYVKATAESAKAFFSHLPIAPKVLPTERSLATFTSLFSLHNYSYGKKKGNPIGDGTAIMPLKTKNDSLYFFNSHATPLLKNNLGEAHAGHAMILGASGTGKSTLIMSMLTFLTRFNPAIFVTDYQRSTQLWVNAIGGTYISLKEGEYSGLNPFQLGDADDKELMAFLKAWVKRVAGDIDEEEEIVLDRAVDSLMQLDVEQRRFSLLMQAGISKNSRLYTKLSKWFGDGALAWATDSPKNLFNPDDLKIIGFDTTAILTGDHPACEIILAVLFFIKERMHRKNHLMLTLIEEFWKPISYPMTARMVQNSLKAGRMKGEMIWLASQSPADAINSELFSAINEQTSTKIALPNPDAILEDYEKIGLTEKEFFVLSKLTKDSRTFLIKQNNSSAFAKLDLHGFRQIPILSGTTKGHVIFDEMEKKGLTNNENWVDIFLEKMNEKN